MGVWIPLLREGQARRFGKRFDFGDVPHRDGNKDAGTETRTQLVYATPPEFRLTAARY